DIGEDARRPVCSDRARLGRSLPGRFAERGRDGHAPGAPPEAVLYLADRTQGGGSHRGRAMTGAVDDFGRALVPVRLKKPATGKLAKVQAWIDTGFTGELVLPKTLVNSLGLTRANVVKAELGDGSEAVIHTYGCELEWFGEPKLI